MIFPEDKPLQDQSHTNHKSLLGFGTKYVGQINNVQKEKEKHWLMIF